MARTHKIFIAALTTLALVFTASSAVALAADPIAGAFDQVVICHRPGTEFQRTMIVRQDIADNAIAHLGARLAPCTSDLPSTSVGVAIDFEKGYLVEEISDGLYWVTEGNYQLMFLTTGEGVIVVDAPPSIGQNILNAIAEVTEEPVTHVIYTHSHADHIAAASLFPEDAVYIAHEETAAILEEISEREGPVPFGTFVGGSPVPAPTVTFSDSFTLEVGSQTLELEYKGVNHTIGNIFVYAPEQKVLMFIDVIFPGWSPFKSLALAKDVPGFIESHDEALSFGFETLVAGHLNRLGTRQDVEVQKEYVLDMQANAVQALQTVDFFAIAQQVGFSNIWLLFDTYLDEVSKECTVLTLEKWDGRLGGADVFTPDHCFSIVESLRID